ncbi:elicitor-responsive protein 3 [Cicer arietinum]|uniref:Elicitor-responsive protein 3 n=1 Tax=Cicer arietinum TaxID=3827 RepID=A0A1S2YW21_CICAR|nr:elicitor-responsive protein 3 [Cicer arietinum]
MKTGILEVLLVNAKGIRHTNIVGTPSYYVIIECGFQSQRSKTSRGKNEKPCWNEKFIFDLSSFDCNMNSTYLTCKIMDTELFTNGGFVGEAKVHIGGIITEGINQGYIDIKPAAYNVVLEDDTYKGQIKIGFKFIANKENYMMRKQESIAEEKGPSHNSICGSIWRISWWKFLFFYNNKINSKDKQKRN